MEGEKTYCDGNDLGLVYYLEADLESRQILTRKKGRHVFGLEAEFAGMWGDDVK